MNQGLDIILILIIIFLPLLANITVTKNYNKYANKINRINLTGAQIARAILDKNGLNYIKVYKGTGHLTDYFDNKNNKIVLSPDVYDNTSISSISVAAHEVGHALQHKEKYGFLKLRILLVPIVNFSSKLSTIFIFISIILGIVKLFDIAIILLLIGLLFHLITLPVEFNASKRAKIELESINATSPEEKEGVKKVLNAAAFTYVAGFLAMALQIIRLLAIRNRD